MAKYQGYVIRKEYYLVQVEADNEEDAQDLILDFDVSEKEPDDIDWDIYDVEEV